MKKKAAIYTRASDESQKDSVNQQEIDCRKWAEERGYEVIVVYVDDGKSGTRFETRPGFMQMVKDIESGQADFTFIIVLTESRFGRGYRRRDNVGWKWYLSRFGVEVIIIHTSSQTGDDVADDVLECIEISEARKYSTHLSDATIRGQKYNASQGNWNGGTVPYAMVRIAVDRSTGEKLRVLVPGQHANQECEKSKLAPGDPLEIEIIRRIFRERVAGLGYREIAERLNHEGVPAPNSGRRRNLDGLWVAGTIRDLLKNLVYTGAMVFNVHSQSHLKGPEKDWINSPDQWTVKEGAHESIISKELFALANKHRQEYQPRNRNQSESDYLLSGLVFCSKCKRKFYGQSQKPKNAKYYECSGYLSRGRSVCSSYKVNQDKVEQFVLTAIRQNILNSDFSLRLEKKLEESLRNQSVERLQHVEVFEKQLADAKIRIARLLTLAENGAGIEALVDRVKAVEKEKTKIERKLEETRVANLSRTEIVEGKKEVQSLVENFETTLKTAPISAQKTLIQKFIHKVIINREEDAIEVYLKPIPLLSGEMNSPLDCIKVVRKMNRKVKRRSADKTPSQQTEVASVETTVLVENK